LKNIEVGNSRIIALKNFVCFDSFSWGLLVIQLYSRLYPIKRFLDSARSIRILTTDRWQIERLRGMIVQQLQ